MLSEHWAPTGVPTIYKVIDSLDAEAESLKIILAKKSGAHSSWSCASDRKLTVSGLRSKVDVLAGEEYFPAFLGRLRSKLSETRHLFWICYTYWTFHPDIVYIDHANIWAAGVLARLARQPTILRLMGVYPAMRASLSRFRPAHLLLRWCYRAPYSAVICTQDGSGIEPWLAKALSSTVPCHKLLNGADLVRARSDTGRFRGLPLDRCIVMFLGKIEAAKGAPEFAEAILAARAIVPNRFHALIVGTGSRLNDVRRRVEEYKAGDDFTFIERLTHSEVSAALAHTDIYVSLNRLGNLSNANLEAMRAGCCIVIPASQPDTCIDIVTDQLVPEGSVWRIPSVDDVAALTSALIELSAQPAKREAMGKAIKVVADEILLTWEERVSAEIRLIRSIARLS